LSGTTSADPAFQRPSADAWIGFGMDHPCLGPRRAAILCVLVSTPVKFTFDGRRQEYV